MSIAPVKNVNSATTEHHRTNRARRGRRQRRRRPRPLGVASPGCRLRPRRPARQPESAPPLAPRGCARVGRAKAYRARREGRWCLITGQTADPTLIHRTGRTRDPCSTPALLTRLASMTTGSAARTITRPTGAQPRPSSPSGRPSSVTSGPTATSCAARWRTWPPQGVRQFLDIGTGLPSANNTHEVAQRVAPQSRVVYVDDNPVVLAHAHALLVGTPEGTTRTSRPTCANPA